MDIAFLNEFVVLAQRGSYQDAADALFLSQSTLSKHVKKIECELGAELLVRNEERLRLTEFGKAFLPYAMQIAALQRDYSIAISDLKPKGRKIVVGLSTDTLFYSSIVPLFTELLSQDEDCRFEIVEDNSAQLKEMLRMNRCDFIVLVDAPAARDREFERIQILEDRMVALLPDDHPLAGRHAVSVAELAGETFVYPKPPSFFADAAMRLCREAGFQPSAPRKENSRLSLIFTLIQQASCVSLFSEYLVENNEMGRGARALACVELEEDFRFSINVLYSRTRRLSRPVRAQLDYLVNCCKPAELVRC